ncbi:hypothetical protein PVAG01_06470 [Phlyctema vagabunda]|uniref:Uncharacterized protein n=1 Tax=Phlyctema vagabunda TaxID=108571 RepID=A0ABR4PG60_9HELO
MDSSQKHHLLVPPPPYLLNDHSLLPLYTVAMDNNHQPDLERKTIDGSQPLPGVRFHLPEFSARNGFYLPIPEVTGTRHWRDLMSTIGLIFASAFVGFIILSVWIGYKAYIALGERLINGFR